MVDEKDAVEVVDLVLEDAGELAVGFDADFGAVFEDGFDFDFLVAGNFAVDFRNGETALVIGKDFAVFFDDFWVDKGGKTGVFLVFEVVADDDDAFVHAHLRGGHGGGKFVRMTGFPVNRKLAHIGDDLLDFAVDASDFGRLLTQARVGGSDDFFH